MDLAELTARARRLGATLEPFAGQVYFSPECHRAYESLGFGPSPRTLAGGVHAPDGPAYFCSRGSVMGQVAGEVIAAAFAVFNPDAVVPSVRFGWSVTDATTIEAARTEGATAQLARILGAEPAGVERLVELLERATAPLRPEGHPLYAGLLAQGRLDTPLGDAWRLADRLREFRGDAHTAAWTSAGFDAVEIGLLTELHWGLPMNTYLRTRAWPAEQVSAGQERLRSRDLVVGDGFSDQGRVEREAVEVATDRQMRPAIEALGDDFDELVEILRPWNVSIRRAGGYLPTGPHELAGLTA